MQENKGAGISPEFYATLELGLNTRQGVAYAGVKEMVDKYCPQAKKAIDYGCGPGRSTRFLKEAGLEEVVGVDINQEMLTKAAQREVPGTTYLQIESGALPFKDGTFDLAFSGIAILEISNSGEAHKVIGELSRVVRDQGIVIILTCTKEGHITESDSFEPLLTEKQKDKLKNGDPVPTRVKETGQEFTDYYWSQEFLTSALQEAGLTVAEVKPTGIVLDQTKDTMESNEKPPYVIYVSKKLSKNN